MHSSTIALFKETIRSGTIASLVMMPVGFIFKFFGLRVGHYGPKVADLLFGSNDPFLLFAQHLVIGWLSTLPLVWLLVQNPLRTWSRFSVVGAGAVYGAAYYVVVNSLTLPLLFGDTLPWTLGVAVIAPSLVVHFIFGISIALTTKKY
ncbi:MAG: hypothetical protein WBK51_17475 [Polaromonas sp.]